jgi:streptomycin 6-kinase
MFEPYLSRWKLTPDGYVIVTRSSRLLPVRRGDERLMLKIALEDEERAGVRLLAWWGGEGAVRVLELDGDALLMERAAGHRSLAEMARHDGDDEATRILCETAGVLHAPKSEPPPVLVPLAIWFRALDQAAEMHGGILRVAAMTARNLLSSPEEVVVLHGDLHHGNVLDAGPRGWLAIDPKGLIGERGFEFANLLRNPDARVAMSPGRFERRAAVIAQVAQVDRTRLLQWTLALIGLSAAWHFEDGEQPALDLAIARLAARELDYRD